MKRTIFGLMFFVLLGVSAAAPAQQGTAASAPTAADAAAVASDADLKGLVKTLENDAERKKLIGQLNALLAAQKASGGEAAKKTIGTRVLDSISRRIESVSGEFVAGTRAIMDVPNIYDWFVRQMSEEKTRARWIEISWKIILALLVGLAGEWVIRRLLTRPRRTLETLDTDSFSIKFVSLLGRTILDIIPIAGFLAASYAALTLAEPGEVTRLVAYALINANVLVRTVLAIARLVLAPATPKLRMLKLRDVDANYLFIWVRRLADVALYGYFIIVAIGLLGLSGDGTDILFKLLGLVGTLMLVVFALQNRKTVADWLRGPDQPDVVLKSLRARIADIWHVAVILYVIVMYGVWALAVEDGFTFVLRATALSIVILVVATFLSKALQRLCRRVFALRDEIKRRYPGLEARANRYIPIVEKSISIVIGAITLFAVFEAWGIDSSAWLATPLGQRIASSAVTIAFMLVVTIVVLEVSSALIERYLSRDGAAVSSRARTLLPLLRTTLLVVLVTLFLLVTLSELGLNIAPLLAGAGVIGLAIGFGAQTLMKDIITGMFILVEDQLAVGDVVKVGSHAGVVETMTLRTIRLRDLAGTVHVVPFSEVTTLENMTKDFSRYVFEVGVAYREDTDTVVEALKQVGDDLLQDEAFKDLIISPLEVLGVDSFGDNAVIIKARITTQPIKQWQVGREFNRRMKKHFDALGIEIPFPHRTIYFGEDREGEAPVARVAMVDGNKDRSTAPQKSLPESPRGDASVAATPETGGVDAPDGD
ncbi:MAG: mechanosensitive ion channel [Rhodospirillaceae bacterium]|jgi:moderate conductance mechanosensitive channel|nr:mechanosensitive ion channel [Rhodospirillaceae bacterium]